MRDREKVTARTRPWCPVMTASSSCRWHTDDSSECVSSFVVFLGQSQRLCERTSQDAGCCRQRSGGIISRAKRPVSRVAEKEIPHQTMAADTFVVVVDDQSIFTNDIQAKTHSATNPLQSLWKTV